MIQSQPREDLIRLLKLIHDTGSTVCVGTCEHRKPGELHCHGISNILKISSSGAKSRLRELVELGFLNKERKEREDGKLMVEYTVNRSGEEVLEVRTLNDSAP
jgi:predicted transcriptional regulator